MFVLQDTSIDFKALEAHQKVLAERILSNLKPSAQNIKLSATQTVFPGDAHSGMIYLLKEGVVAHSVFGTPLFRYEAGEIIGLDHLLSRSTAVLSTDFAVIVDAYSGADLIKAASANPSVAEALYEYLAGQSQLLGFLCQNFLKKTAEAAPEIRAVTAGDEVFLEGTQAAEVFTLVEGEAEALVDGVVVGRVLPGELFGVVAALAGTTRTATVRATKNCTVLVIAKDNFSQLIESRPATVLRMVEEMARTLVSNESAMSQVSLSKF